MKKTLQNIRKTKYGKAPINGREILSAFQNENTLNQLGFSLLKDRGPLFNDVVITKHFENCIFSSAETINLVLKNIPESERFFILDATFRITPKGEWQQVLILHVNFGIKVRQKVFVSF